MSQGANLGSVVNAAIPTMTKVRLWGPYSPPGSKFDQNSGKSKKSYNVELENTSVREFSKEMDKKK